VLDTLHDSTEWRWLVNQVKGQSHPAQLTNTVSEVHNVTKNI